MKPQVIPLSRQVIDWDIMTKVVSTVLGRTITRSTDEANKPIGDYSSYIGLLGEMKFPGSNYQNVIQHPGNLISHLYFSFVLVANEEDFVFLALEAGVSSTITNYAPAVCLGVVTGSLLDWRNAIINCCVPQANPNIINIFNQIFVYFEKLKLSPLWYDFVKKQQSDGNFVLEMR